MAADVRGQIIEELRDVFLAIREPSIETLVDRLASAKTVFTYGVGREGLVLRSFCMRLFHLGLDAHVVGDMTTPHLGPGDLLVTSSGPGYFSTVAALMGVAHKSGGKVLIVTANPDAELPRQADDVVVIPGQTMAGGTAERPSIQPMGSLYEQAMWLLFDYTVLVLAQRLGRSFREMSHRHTNME
ncbi:MAG: 6-phospho-3-hexuloisomerase [Armatimonadota bacterium]|nr:6-phospho-3-hexuloisomerase [Armatimonadota bacterium]